MKLDFAFIWRALIQRSRALWLLSLLWSLPEIQWPRSTHWRHQPRNLSYTYCRFGWHKADIGLKVDKEVLIQESPFRNVKADDEKYSGPFGNGPVLAQHSYRRTVRYSQVIIRSEANLRHQVAVVIPRCHRMEFFISPNITDGYPYRNYFEIKPRVIEWIRHFSEQLKRNSEEATAVESLDQICKMMIRRTKAFNSRQTSVAKSVREHAPFSN